MKQKNKRILITGGAGYIGSMLSTHLVNCGYVVTVIDNFSFTYDSLNHLYSKDNFHFIEGDVNNKKLIKKLVKQNDIVIPLAALVGAPLCEKNKNLAIKLNIDSIKLILSSLNKKQKIIYLTTNSGYGIGEKSKYCDETSPLNPVSLYGITKNKAEELVRKINKNYICFRLATVFGFSFRMRTDLLVNNFVYRALFKKKLDIFEPNFRRNFIHISDVIKCIEYSIKNFNSLKNNVYNLGLSNANITKLRLAKLIKKKIPSCKIKIIKNASDPDKRDYFVSNKKIEKMGFKATKSLESGIVELINVFKKNNIIIKNNY